MNILKSTGILLNFIIINCLMIEPTYSKDLISNAAKSGVMTFTEINDNLQGVELSEEILEIFAELTQQTMEKAKEAANRSCDLGIERSFELTA